MKNSICFSLIFLFAFSFSYAQPKRELRGAWIATYSNIDWPQRNHSPFQQQAELIRILNTLQETGINVIYLQVRSQCDALYPSTLEPWSADLTGIQGLAPEPLWDPMEFAILEAHKRGMEFHAWINPYRAISNISSIANFSPSHIARKHPQWLLSAGNLRTLNPALPEVREHILKVISDIVTRYNVDGIHFDDYFYPEGNFNDQSFFAKDPRGFSDRDDWRRDNVNLLIKQTSETIRTIKPWVKFGISPTGIYMNSKNPLLGTPTSGKQHFSELFSDSRKWIREGWVDYLEPQVYWYSRQPGSAYNIVTPWWNDQASGRHIYIGVGGYKAGVEPGWQNNSEIPLQVRLALSDELINIKGISVYNTSSLMANRMGMRDSLKNIFRIPALLPQMPWRDSIAPPAPVSLRATKHDKGTLLEWAEFDDLVDEMDKPKQFVIYRRENPESALESSILAIIPAGHNYLDVSAEPDKLYVYSITAVDRFHNESLHSNIAELTGKNHPPISRIQVTIPDIKVPDKELPAASKPEPKEIRPSPSIPTKLVTATFSKVPEVRKKSNMRIEIGVEGVIEFVINRDGKKITWGVLRSNSTPSFLFIPGTSILQPGDYNIELKFQNQKDIWNFRID